MAPAAPTSWERMLGDLTPCPSAGTPGGMQLCADCSGCDLPLPGNGRSLEMPACAHCPSGAWSRLCAFGEAPGFAPALVGLEMGVRHREDRVVDAMAPRALEHPAHHVVGLDLAAALEVAQHRGAPEAFGIGEARHGPLARLRARRVSL